MAKIEISYITKQGRTASAELQVAINEIVTQAQAELTLPETIDLFILLDVSSKQTGEYGVYFHEGGFRIVNGKYQGRTGRPTINIETLNLTIKQIRWTLAHEFGHAEHFTTQPESRTWAKAQQERYANRTAERICHYGVYVPAE